MSIEIDVLKSNDWPDVQAIYTEGLATGIASFNVDAPEWDEWDESYLEIGRIVAKENTGVLGWAALSSVGST